MGASIHFRILHFAYPYRAVISKRAHHASVSVSGLQGSFRNGASFVRAGLTQWSLLTRALCGAP